MPLRGEPGKLSALPEPVGEKEYCEDEGGRPDGLEHVGPVGSGVVENPHCYVYY